jgi:hypothetical protein
VVNVQASTPEPGSMTLFAAGMSGLILAALWKRPRVKNPRVT